MKSIRLFTAAAMAAAGLVVAGAATESASAAVSKDLTTTYSSVIAGEKFSLAGHVQASRTVKLQYRSKTTDPWTTKSTPVTSSASGNFAFTNLTTTKTRYYRFYAPATGGYSKILGNSKKITVVSQKVGSYLTPNPIYFYTDGGSVNETVHAVITIYPARERSVKFTTPNGANITVYTDSKGHAVAPFNLNKGAGTYSIVPVVQAANGAPAKSGSPASIVVKRGYFIIL